MAMKKPQITQYELLFSLTTRNLTLLHLPGILAINNLFLLSKTFWTTMSTTTTATTMSPRTSPQIADTITTGGSGLNRHVEIRNEDAHILPIRPLAAATASSVR